MLVLTGKQRCTGRCTNGVVIEFAEAYTFGCEFIQVGCLYLGAIRTYILETHIIHHDQYHIGLACVSFLLRQ